MSYHSKKERDAAYRASHRKELAEKQREYYRSHLAQRRAYSKDYQEKHKLEQAERSKKHRAKNLERVKSLQKEWRESNAKHLREYQKRYYAKHKQQILANGRRSWEKRKNDPMLKLRQRMRTRIRTALKAYDGNMAASTREIIGCGWDDLWRHLLATWEANYGRPWQGEPFHVDHITPLSFARTEEEVKELCHYGNLQMLTPEDNLRKHDKFELKWLI